MGLRVHSQSCVFLFSIVQVLVGCRKQFMNSFVYPTWACAAGSNNNNNNINNNNNNNNNNTDILITLSE